MRKIFMMTVLSILAVGSIDSAHAGKKAKKEKKPKKEKAAKSTAPMQIETIGIPDLDAVFEKAVSPVNKVFEARTKTDSVSTNLNTALGLPAGTPFKDAIADLKEKAGGKLKLAMDAGGMPTLSAADGVPDNVSGAINALNTSFTDAGAAIAALKSVPGELTEVVSAAQALDPASVLKGAGAKVTEIPKMLKKFNNNLKVLKGAPGEVDALISSIGTLKSDLTDGLK